MARMKDFYKEEVAPALMKKFGYKSRSEENTSELQS